MEFIDILMRNWPEIIAGVSVIINLLIAYYIFRQVKVAKIIGQQNVMPILGIAVGESRISGISRNIAAKNLEAIFCTSVEEMHNAGIIMGSVENLVVYIQFAIAKKIKCKILKDGEIYESFEKPSAVPIGDERLPIRILDISKNIEALSNDQKIEFVAHFVYQSVLGDEYKCTYKLSTGRFIGEQTHDLEFDKLPWD